MEPTRVALREAIALLTSAAGTDDELNEALHRALDEQPAPDLVLALVTLGRELCFMSARLIHTIDDHLTDAETSDLTDDAVRPAALQVLRVYGLRVAPEPSEHT